MNEDLFTALSTLAAIGVGLGVIGGLLFLALFVEFLFDEHKERKARGPAPSYRLSPAERRRAKRDQ